jgi:hypothetical protein
MITDGTACAIEIDYSYHVLTIVVWMAPPHKVGVMIFSPKLFSSHGQVCSALSGCSYDEICASVEYNLTKNVVFHEVL